ncbi:MAG: lipoyl(octanoyl) transferase LipB [candidate division WOR-3 bacterium]
MKNLNILLLGKKDYKEVWDFQKELVEKRKKDFIPDTLIICEHFPVYTTGSKGNLNNLLVDENFLKVKGIPLYHIERGGDITYHGPGQLVSYPIIKLDDVLKSIRKFVYNLEEVMIKVLMDFGIKGERKDKNIGVFVNGKKIGSIGVAVRNSVTFHGLAFNINMDLSPFKWIKPCGLDVEMTDISKEKKKDIKVEDVIPGFIEKFKEVFGYN